MATYLVFVDGDAKGWRVDRDALTSVIEAGWSNVEVDPIPRSEACSFRWFFDTDEYRGEAFLHEEGTCLYLDVPEQDTVRLAVAFRRLAPPELDLIFCDQGYFFDVRLRADATDAELVELMGIS